MRSARAHRARTHRSARAWMAAVVTLVVVSTGCVSDRSDDLAQPRDPGPGGPACQAAAAVGRELVTDETTAPDPVQVATALRGLGGALPVELQQYVADVLVDDETPVDEALAGRGDVGLTRVEAAWVELETWSVTMCEQPLVPASWLATPLADVIGPEGWGDDTSTTITPARDGSATPPPAFAAVVADVAGAKGTDADGWWSTDGLSGIVSAGAQGIEVQAAGADGPEQALQVCTDVVHVLDGSTPTKVVVRGIDGVLLAFTDGSDGCRPARGV